MAAETNLKFPFGGASAFAPDYAASLEVEIDNDVKSHLIVDDMTGALTLTVTANADLGAGAQLFALLTNTGTGAAGVTLSGDAAGTVADVAAGETDLIQLEFIDGAFAVVSQQSQ